MQEDLPKPKLFTDKLKRLIYSFAQPLLSRFYFYYTSRTTSYRYKGIQVSVLKGVFHPRFTISTKYLVDYIQPLDLKGKTVLELGCGSGLISLHAAKKGANVIASDINDKAVEGIIKNADHNGLAVTGIKSDLFEKIPESNLDLIIINPPYYPQDPKSTEEAAWFCGEDFDYFKRLFEQLPSHTQKQTQILMILSEDCDLTLIKNIASQQGFLFKKRSERVIKGEPNFIFSIQRN